MFLLQHQSRRGQSVSSLGLACVVGPEHLLSPSSSPRSPFSIGSKRTLAILLLILGSQECFLPCRAAPGGSDGLCQDPGVPAPLLPLRDFATLGELCLKWIFFFFNKAPSGSVRQNWLPGMCRIAGSLLPAGGEPG